MAEMVQDVVGCARCGNNHEQVSFAELTCPVEIVEDIVWAWWAPCPSVTRLEGRGLVTAVGWEGGNGGQTYMLTVRGARVEAALQEDEGAVVERSDADRNPQVHTPALAAARRVYQCPGCWSISQIQPPSVGGSYECDCGEKLTCIDMRGES